MVNSVKLKIFLVWSKIQPKTTEIIFSPYFHFKPFPHLFHTHSSLTHALPLSKLHCSDPHTEPNGTIHTDAPRSRSRQSPELRRLTSITIIEIGEIAIAISSILREASIAIAIDALRDRDRDRADRGRDCDLTEKIWSFLGFIWVFRNEWHYVFVW